MQLALRMHAPGMTSACSDMVLSHVVGWGSPFRAHRDMVNPLRTSLAWGVANSSLACDTSQWQGAFCVGRHVHVVPAGTARSTCCALQVAV